MIDWIDKIATWARVGSTRDWATQGVQRAQKEESAELALGDPRQENIAFPGVVSHPVNPVKEIFSRNRRVSTDEGRGAAT